MLTNFLNYFSRCTKVEGLQAACFLRSSERYLTIKYNGDFTDDELLLIAIKIAKEVGRELI